MFRIDMGISKPQFSTISINLAAAAFMAFGLNDLFWRTLIASFGHDVSGNFYFIAAIGSSLFLLFNILLSAVSLKHIHKPFLIALFLISATCGYFMNSYGIVIDKQMITNLLQTDFREASEQLTWPLMRHLLLWGIIPSTLLLLTNVSYRPLRRELMIRGGVILASSALLAAIVALNFKQFALFGRAHKELRMYINPTYPIYSLFKVVSKDSRIHGKEPRKVVAADATKPTPKDRTVVVLVVGETARAREFSLNGYQRDTNPQLGHKDIVNFTAVQSCGTDTAESLPCMFSNLGRNNYSASKAGEYENILDILNRTGVRVVWRDNNSGSKGVADRVVYEDLSHEKDESLCSTGECYDEILLKGLASQLRENTGDMLIVLHQKGSHGPSYYKRSPKEFKVFMPECTQDDVQNCSQQSIINAYDNTIRYTDTVLAQLIDLLKAEKFPTAMLYVSDHGESLGENNIYLHGLPYALAPDEQTHVPMVFWGSDSFLRDRGLSPALLTTHASDQITHDSLFHTMLGLFRIKTQEYRPDLDIFSFPKNHRT